MHFVRSNLLALTASAHHDAKLCLAIAHCPRHCGADRWIVNAFGGVSSEVGNHMTCPFEHADEMLLQFEACMIGTDRNGLFL